MACIPINNPQLPFLGQIPGGMTHGRMIRIKGFLFPDADRLSINLQSGPGIDLDDICLHVDIRPGEESIVRNHYTDESGWGYEERDGGCPIFPGQNFELLILAQNDCYKIAVNGGHFCEFNHRIPLQAVQFIYICNDGNIFSINLEGDAPQPQTGYDASAPPFMAVCPAAPPGYNPQSASLSYGAPPGMYQPGQGPY